MAKRKRLSPIISEASAVEAKPSASRAVPPIADIVDHAATHAALEEVSNALQSARSEGRLVQRIALESVDAAYLVRDRVQLDPGEMEGLRESIRARGQQTPVEVIALGEGRFGLISGWRRLSALHSLFLETEETRFATVDCLVRTPPRASDAYLAMVEENEIRAGISFYERARIAARAAELGVFETPQVAIKALFANAPRARRSKINSFLALYEALDDKLTYPSVISERLGLGLVKILQKDVGAASKLRRALTRAGAGGGLDAQKELAVLEGVLKGPVEVGQIKTGGVTIERKGQRITLMGPEVDADFEVALTVWLENWAKN